MARVFLDEQPSGLYDPSLEDLLSFIAQEEEAKRKNAMEEEAIIADIISKGGINPSFPEVQGPRPASKTLTNLFGLSGNDNQLFYNKAEQENLPNLEEAEQIQEEAAPTRRNGSISSDGTSFAVSGDETFENSRGSFSRMPEGTSDAASKRFADFLNGLSQQRERDLLNTSNKKVKKLLNSDDPESGTQIAQILQGVSNFRGDDSRDINSLLEGQKKMLEIDKIQQEIAQNGDKPLKQFIKESWDTGVINGEDRLFLERYVSDNPDATIKELSDLLIEANSDEEEGRDKFKNSKLAKLFSKRLNGE